MVGPYLIVTTFTITKEGRRIVWEEVLIREGTGYRFTQTLSVLSAPHLLLSAVAVAQGAGRGQPVDVTGWTISPMSLGADGGWTAAPGAGLDDGAVLIAWKFAYAPPVVLETYSGSDEDLLWLKGVRALYQGGASTAELNALWDLNPGESARDDKPIDPLYWLGSETPTLILGAISGPQGRMFLAIPEGGDTSRFFFVRAGSTRRLATGIIWTDAGPKAAGEAEMLNRLLNGSVLPAVLAGK